MKNSLKKQNIESYLPFFINNATKAEELLAKHSGEFDCYPLMMMLTLEVTIGKFNISLKLIILLYMF